VSRKRGCAWPNALDDRSAESQRPPILQDLRNGSLFRSSPVFGAEVSWGTCHVKVSGLPMEASTLSTGRGEPVPLWAQLAPPLRRGYSRIVTVRQDSIECIYPGPHGAKSPEHYLPAALGTFRGYEPLQDRVCRNCNKRIGDQTETQFLRGGQIAFFRWLLAIEGRDGLLPSPFSHGAAGAPPLVMVGQIREFPFPLLLEVEPGTEDVYPLRQIIFDGGLAGVHPIAITDRMRDDARVLRDHLTDRGLGSARPIHAFAAEDEMLWMGELMRAFGGELASGWATTQFTPQRLQLVVLMKVTSTHFRAVAKIVFHYALKIFQDFTGKEREFDPIKGFIWDGGDVDRFVRQRRADQVIQNWRRGQGPTHWMHILAVERTYDRIVGWFQPFVGPRSLLPLYEVSIGMDPSRIARRREQKAHQFVILDPRAASGEVGVMEDLQPANYIRLP
jgi:hypothetical protein